MFARVLLLAAASAVIALVALAPPTAKPAAACSLALLSVEETAELAKLIVVGETVSERPLDGDYGSIEAFESTIHVVSALKGRPAADITISPVGFLGADCSGGPRLPAGERVLLFLGEPGDVPRVIGYGAGKYVLTAREAAPDFGDTIPVEPILRRVAAVTGASPVQVDAALAFARGEPAPAPQPEIEPLPADVAGEDEDGGLRLLLAIPLAGGATIVLLTALLLLRRRLRAR